MKYKITQQYARGEEKLIAEFRGLNEARIFMTKKTSYDDIERKKNIYRIYEEHELLQEYNEENISIAHAKYAEGNSDFDHVVNLFFKVMVKSINSLEQQYIANFTDLNNAKLYVVSKCDADNTVSDNDLFFIFKDKILFDTLSKNIIASRNKKTVGSNTNQKEAKFRPTPMPTRPTPPGGPSDFWVEEDSDNENQK